MEDNEQVRELLKGGKLATANTTLTSKVMRRARASVGQRDTLLFAIVRIWTVIAELLAPIFAQIAARQAEFSARKLAKTTDQSESK